MCRVRIKGVRNVRIKIKRTPASFRLFRNSFSSIEELIILVKADLHLLKAFLLLRLKISYLKFHQKRRN